MKRKKNCKNLIEAVMRKIQKIFVKILHKFKQMCYNKRVIKNTLRQNSYIKMTKAHQHNFFGGHNFSTDTAYRPCNKQSINKLSKFERNRLDNESRNPLKINNLKLSPKSYIIRIRKAESLENTKKK